MEMSGVTMEERDYFFKAEQAYAATQLLEPAKQHSGEGSSQPDKELQAVELFRRYFPEKPKKDNGRNTNTAEAELGIEKNIRRLPPRALIPPKFQTSMSRSLSFLEQQLLPAGTRSGGGQTSPRPATDNKSSKAQLTIFYAGSIHVYDNVSVEKAQAIMFLAGESCLSQPTKEMPNTDPRLSLALCSPTARPEEAGVPIARKISLQHFLQKRYQRMREGSPYAGALSPRREDEVEEINIRDVGMSKRERVSSSWLSPFPSRLGHLSSPAV